MPLPISEIPVWTPEALLAGPIALGEPFVLRGAASSWPVVAEARRGDSELLDYLRGFAVDNPIDYVTAQPSEHGRMHYDDLLRGFNFTRERASLTDFLDQLARSNELEPAPALAAQGVPADRAAPCFTQANRFTWLPPSAQARLWIGNQVEVAIHSDPADNIACVVAGQRKFTLFAPECLSDLAMGPFDPTPAGTPISMADPLAPDQGAYPRFAAALEQAQQALLEPGDAIFIPYGWYHHVQSLDPVSMLVNHWWNEAPQDGGSPWDAMLHAIMSLRHLPAPQRRAWLAMFRHYAFLVDGDPAAHLPAHAAGILGAKTPADRRAMRRMLVKNLTGAADMARLRLAAAALVLQLGLATAAQAGLLKVAAPFSDNAVLQRAVAVPVWGSAEPGERISVSFDGTSREVSADAAGQWRVDIPSGDARLGTTLMITSSNGGSVSFSNVAVGDVWLCSGQSNMEFEASRQSNAPDIVARSEDPALRLLLVPRQRNTVPSSEFARHTSWQTARPESVASFSAVCHAMGQALRARAPDVPVGLISAAWSGSRIEDWLSQRALVRLGGYQGELALLAAHAADPEPAERRFAQQREAWLEQMSRLSPSGPVVTAGSLRNGWEGWDIPALAAFDGVGVYRFEFTLSSATRRRVRALRLGRIDDIDRTRLNGRTIGSTAGWDTPRRYPMPPGSLRSGRNELEVLVVDTGGGGGFYGAEPRGLELDDGTIVPFDGGATFTPLAPLAAVEPVPVAPWSGGEGLATLDQGMIAPLGHYRVKGFAWYQGESNVPRASRYAAQLEALIADWRERLGGREFLIVQLAGFGRYAQEPSPSAWADLREAQRQVALKGDAVRLVPTMDIGDPYDIHPANKREVGRRLALAGAGEAGVRGDIMVKRVGGLLTVVLPAPYQVVGGARTPTGFEVCDATGRCRLTDVRLAAPNLIELPVAATDRKLRYLWADSALTSLFDRDGVPLAPFEENIPDSAKLD